MNGNNNIELKNITFNPPESITFEAVDRRQTFPFEIRNNETIDIIVKWKSTRCIYNTQPNFAIIKSGESKTFDLICKGVEDCDRRHITRDRFSAIISAIKPTEMNAKQIWRNYDLRENLFIGKVHKKMVFVQYLGINETEWWNESLFGNPPGPPVKRPTFMLQQNDDVPDELKTCLSAGKYTHVLIPLDNIQ